MKKIFLALVFLAVTMSNSFAASTQVLLGNGSVAEGVVALDQTGANAFGGTTPGAGTQVKLDNGAIAQGLVILNQAGANVFGSSPFVNGLLPVDKGGWPSNSINLKDRGLPTGGDDTAALNAIFTEAKTKNKSVYAPSGTYYHGNVLSVDSIRLYGDGANTIFTPTDTSCVVPNLVIRVQGNNVEVDHLTLNFSPSVPCTNRINNSNSDAIASTSVVPLTNSRIHDIKITGNWPSVGLAIIQNNNAVNVEIDHNTITGVFQANPLMVSAPTNGINIHDNYMDILSAGYAVVGDNCIEVSDLRSATPAATGGNVNVSVVGNILNGCYSVGTSFVGVTHGVIANNVYSNTGYSSIYVSSERANYYGAASNPSAPSVDIVVEGNVISSSGWHGGAASILLIGQSGYPVKDISIMNNHITMTNAINTTGIAIGECGAGNIYCSGTLQASNVKIVGNTINGNSVSGTTVGQYGLNITAAQDVTVSENHISNLSSYAVTSGNTNFGFLKLMNNNINASNVVTNGVFNLSNSGWAHVMAANNSYTASTAHTSTVLAWCSGLSDVSGYNNIGDINTFSGCTAYQNTAGLIRGTNVGIGTTAANASLDVASGTVLVRGGTLPSSSSCGVSPIFTGAPSSFKAAMGSGTLTSCVITNAFTTAPSSCVLTPANAAAVSSGAYVSALSTSGMTVTGTNLTSATFYIHCF